MDVEALASPLYEPTEAARLVGLSSGQVSRWLFGYAYPYREERRRQNPLVRRQLGTTEARRASFLDLVELRAAKLFLDHGCSAQRVRRAFKEAQALTEEPFPFASQRIYTAGPRIFLARGDAGHVGGERLLELCTGGQWVIEPLIRDYLTQLEFDERSGLADTWWPLGRNTPVLISPKRASGSPTVKTLNLKTSTVFDLYLAEGRHAELVARWFHLPVSEVAAAVRFEEGLNEAKAA